WQEYAAAWRDLRGYQIAVVILFLSCYVEGFLSDIALRASSALQESPANPANLGRIGLIGAGALVAFYLGRARLDELPRGFSGPLRGIFCFAAVAVLSSTYSSLPLVSAGKALEVMADIGTFVLLVSLLYADDFRRSWNILWLIMALLLAAV